MSRSDPLMRAMDIVAGVVVSLAAAVVSTFQLYKEYPTGDRYLHGIPASLVLRGDIFSTHFLVSSSSY